MPEMQISYICIQRPENSMSYFVWTPFSGAGVRCRGGSAIYYWQLFQYILADTISIVFLLSIDSIKFSFVCQAAVAGWVICQILPFCFLFLGYYKTFQAEMAFNYKQPQVLGWSHNQSISADEQLISGMLNLLFSFVLYQLLQNK